MQPLVTVLVHFHRERHLAYPALRSAVLAAEEAASRGIGCRVAAIIDRGDDATRVQVARFRPRLDAVHDVDFGDLARARNHGISCVDTKYFAFLDGDDLFDRDWLWKGVLLLEELGGGRTVAHAAARLSFGSELYGRIQIPTDSPLFHPLNLIASWHYAADLIAPVDLFRRLPFAPFDREHNLGAEDWLWTCESVVAGIRHVIVPETAYFYRRQLGHVSLGALRGFTFGPTRLLEREAVSALIADHPSAAIRFADRAVSQFGARQRWTGMPPWLAASVERACELDLGLYDLHLRRTSIALETPYFYPAVGHFYLKLMAQLGEGSARVIFLCERLAAWDLEVIDDFLAAQRRRRAPAIDVVIIALGPSGDGALPASPAADDGEAWAPDAPWVRLRHVDLGAEPAFARLWEHERHSLIVRFLLQARPELVVNLDSAFFDTLIAAYGPAVASGGTRSVRVCHARHVADDVDGPFADWYNLMRAESRYSAALCRSPELAERLNAFYDGSGLTAASAGSTAGTGERRSMGATLHDWLVGSAPWSAGVADDSLAASTPPAAARPTAEPDVTVVVPTRFEGYYLNPMVRALASTVADAAGSGLRVEIVIVAGRPGPRTCRILATIASRRPDVRVVETDLDDEGANLNAGLAAARGRYAAVVPASELVSPGWLARAVRRCREAGSDAIVHPHALVEYGAAFRVGYQPDMDAAGSVLADLAFHETWTTHALAPRELFQRIPYRHVPAGSGYGHAAWHWNCETVAQGCRHLTVPETAVYRRAAGLAGESVPTLGAIAVVTLPPSRFFTAHAWLQVVAFEPAAPRRADWDEVAYRRAHADVARAVEAGVFPSGYAHYRSHGRNEGRSAIGKGRRPNETAARPTPAPPQPSTGPVPADWDDAAYLDAWPEVARAVAAGMFPSGYAHYCLYGRQQVRAASWAATTAASGAATAAPGVSTARPPASRLPAAVPPWLKRGLPACPAGLYRIIAAAKPPPPGAPLLTRWLDEEMRVLAEMDPGLNPRCVGAPYPVPPRDLWAAETYRECWRAVEAARPTHIFLAPALRTGGAELAMGLLIGTLLESPDNRPLVITTESRHDGRGDRLPPRCTWLPFPAAAEGPVEERIEVLTRLLVNSGARALHLFYSQLGWDVLRRHAPALAERMRIFVSIFSVPPVAAGQGTGYALYLGPLLPHLAGILTDNQRAATALQEVCGVPREQVVVLRHPVAAAARFKGPNADGKLVLWAGRLDSDKRPDQLRAIAELLPDVRFHVYGAAVLDDNNEIERLRAVPNIDYRGPFAGFDAIPAAPYRCFLYTSTWDGTPNVLLEAMQAGLLVVASDVGGVGEVVDDDTGLLVRDADDPVAYAAAIRRTLEKVETWRRVAANGQRRVAETFTAAAFREALRSVPGYLA